MLHGWAAGPLGAGWATLLGGVGVIVALAVATVLIPSFWRYELR